MSALLFPVGRFDSSENIFGTTSNGGADGDGVAFEIAP
jgi:hypothetical protein